MSTDTGAEAMPSGGIRAAVGKGRQKAREGAGAFSEEKKRAKCSSYLGELSPEAPNLLQRDSAAERPFEKMTADITEFALGDGKVYLSPAIGRFDGMPIAWTIGASPNAKLANDMLRKVHGIVLMGTRCIVYSDRGCHYRWPGWIGLMREFGFVRSMSKKGRSPDNSACEGVLRNNQKRDVLQRRPIGDDGQGVHPLSGRISGPVHRKENQGITGLQKHD